MGASQERTACAGPGGGGEECGELRTKRVLVSREGGKKWLEKRQGGKWAEPKSTYSAGHQRSQSLLKKQGEGIEGFK